jgi:hypothetical protein
MDQGYPISRMRMLEAQRSSDWTTAAALLAAVLFLLLSWSPYHYWDEFFYLFSAAAHTPRELIRFEPTQTLFPNGFFTGKIGHVVLLRLLLDALGPGRTSLIIIQSLYALMVVAFSAAGWGLLRELLDRRSADTAALVLLFLPVTTYLGYKTLSEVPSMLFIALGCWSFLRSYREPIRIRVTLLLALSVLCLALGTLCRFTSMLTFVGLVAGMILSRHRRLSARGVIRAVVVLVASLLLYLVVLYGLGGSVSQLAGIAYHTASRQGVGMERIYALALTVQGLIILLPFAVWRRRDEPMFRMAAIWLAFTAVPALMVFEPRYYAPALIPLAMLGAFGLRNFTRSVFRTERSLVPVTCLALLVLIDHAVFSPLMPYEIDQNRLMTAMEQLQQAAPDGSFLVPWISDWAFIRIVFPRTRALLCISAAPTSRYTAEGRSGIMPAADRWWSGPRYYVGSRAALSQEPGPWYYIGWTFSPPLMRLRDLLQSLGIHWADNPGRVGGHDHMTGSWVWTDRGLSLRQIEQDGQYHVFQVLSGHNRSARPEPGA